MGTQRPARAPQHGIQLTLAVGMLTMTVIATGCSGGYEVLGTHTARVLINGSEVADQPPIQCEQVQRVWFIKSLQETPGFSAQVSTGETVDARLVRIDNLGGFTGSSWNATAADTATPAAVEIDGKVVDGTFTITGTAMGFYHDDPAETATADYEIRTDC